MGFPRQLSMSLAGYIAGNKLRGRKRFPMALMLEPSFRCNLACAGCGRIREYHDIVDQMLSAEDCLAAVDEAGAPVVCLTGGEPLLHPDIQEIVTKLVERKYFTHLATNGLLLEASLPKFKPSPYLNFVLHLDSLTESHDRFAGRKGVFDTAIAAMRAAKKAGFRVLVNTTVYKRTDPEEIKRLFRLLSSIPVNGLMVSPAFSYEAVSDDVFLSRQEAVTAFQPVYALRSEFPFYNTPVFLDFLAGKRGLTCTPWSTPTRNPMGWKRPCYLITDGHCQSFRELMDDTLWENYGPGNDPRCANCMVHCGFEASALDQILRSLPALWQTVRWNFFSRNGRGGAYDSLSRRTEGRSR